MNVHNTTITIRVIYSQLLWSSSPQSWLQCKGQHKTCDLKPWWGGVSLGSGKFLHTEQTLHVRVISAGKRARGGNGKKTLNMFEAKSVFSFSHTYLLKVQVTEKACKNTVTDVGTWMHFHRGFRKTFISRCWVAAVCFVWKFLRHAGRKYLDQVWFSGGLFDFFQGVWFVFVGSQGLFIKWYFFCSIWNSHNRGRKA